jgi:hypothetical protein
LTEVQQQLAATLQRLAPGLRSPEQEVDVAMGVLDNIRQVAGDSAARAQILPLAQRLGLRIGLRFVDAIKVTKQRVRRLAGGIVAFGDAPFPLHQRPAHLPHPSADQGKNTPHEKRSESTENTLKATTAPGSSLVLPGAVCRPETCLQEGVSFTKDSRGDRTPIELFCRGAEALELHIKHLILAAA